MGIVKISDVMHANLRATSGALGRSINAQAEHWMRVGMLSELYPSLTYGEICRILIQADAGESAVRADAEDRRDRVERVMVDSVAAVQVEDNGQRTVMGKAA